MADQELHHEVPPRVRSADSGVAEPRRLRRAALGIALLFTLSAAAWSFLIPVGEAPDEGAHLRYAEFIARHGRLPDPGDIVRDNLVEGFQPPLYHALLAVLIRATGFRDSNIKWVDNPAFRGTNERGLANLFDHAAMRRTTAAADVLRYRLLRLPNALFGGLLIWTILSIIAAAGLTGTCGMVVLLWAVTPAALWSAATAGNDLLAALFCAVALWLILKYGVTGRVAVPAGVGLALGLGVLTKMTVVFFWVPLAAYLFFWRARRTSITGRLLIIVLPLAIAGWSMLRSAALHTRKVDAERVLHYSVSVSAWLMSWLQTAAKVVYHSVFTGAGVLGAQAVWLPGWYYGLYMALAALLIIRAVRIAPGSDKTLRVSWTGWIALLGLYVMSLFWFRESGEAMHSRLYLPFMPAVLLSLAPALQTEIPPFRIGRFRRLGILIVGILSLCAGFFPAEMWTPAAAAVRRSLSLGQPVLHYSMLLSLTLLITGTFLVSILFLRPALNGLIRLARTHPFAQVGIAAGGFVLATGVLWFHTLSILGAG